MDANAYLDMYEYMDVKDSEKVDQCIEKDKIIETTSLNNNHLVVISLIN